MTDARPVISVRVSGAVPNSLATPVTLTESPIVEAVLASKVGAEDEDRRPMRQGWCRRATGPAVWMKAVIVEFANDGSRYIPVTTPSVVTVSSASGEVFPVPWMSVIGVMSADSDTVRVKETSAVAPSSSVTVAVIGKGPVSVGVPPSTTRCGQRRRRRGGCCRCPRCTAACRPSRRGRRRPSPRRPSPRHPTAGSRRAGHRRRSRWGRPLCSSSTAVHVLFCLPRHRASSRRSVRLDHADVGRSLARGGAVRRNDNCPRTTETPRRVPLWTSASPSGEPFWIRGEVGDRRAPAVLLVDNGASESCRSACRWHRGVAVVEHDRVAGQVGARRAPSPRRTHRRRCPCCRNGSRR